jgi:hypothetical protein
VRERRENEREALKESISIFTQNAFNEISQYNDKNRDYGKTKRKRVLSKEFNFCEIFLAIIGELVFLRN